MKYLKRILAGLVALPIALIIVTGINFLVLLALPIIWFIIILWWVNDMSHRLNKDPYYTEEEEIIEDE